MVVLDIISKSEQQTLRAAQDFAATLHGGEYLAMYGDLGAGKTVFVRGLAAVLAPEGIVSSPSYAIVHEYGGRHNFCHFDMYRITGEDDLFSIGYFDYADSIMAVEWSEKIADILPKERYEIHIDKLGEEERQIRIEKLP